MKRIQKSLVVILFLDLVVSYPSPEEHTGPSQQKFSRSQNYVPNNAINNAVTPEGIAQPRPNLGKETFWTTNGPLTKSLPTGEPISNSAQQGQSYENYLQSNQATNFPPLYMQQQIQGQQRADYNRRLASHFKIQNEFAFQNDPRLPVLGEANIAAVPLQRYQINNFQNLQQTQPVREQYPVEQVLPRPLNPTFQRPRTGIPTQRVGIPVETKSAVTINPVHQIFNPFSGYNLQQILATNPTVKNVYATTKHQKRYMVIHPDGRVEHVDEIEAIAKKHPNHVLVNAGPITSLDNRSMLKPIATSQSAKVDAASFEPTKIISETPNKQLTAISDTPKPQGNVVSTFSASVNAERHKSIVTSSTVVPPEITSREILVPQNSVVSSEAAKSPESTIPLKSLSVPKTQQHETVTSQEIEVPYKSFASSEAMTIPVNRTPYETLPALSENIIPLETETPGKTFTLQTNVIPLQDEALLEPVRVLEIITPSERVVTPETTSLPETDTSSSTANQSSVTTRAEYENTTAPKTVTSSKTVTTSKKYDNNEPTVSNSSVTVIQTSPGLTTSSSATATSGTTEPSKPCASENESTIVATDSTDTSNAAASSTSTSTSSSSTSDASSSRDSISNKRTLWFKTSESKVWDKVLAKDPINLIFFYHVPSQTAGNDENHEERKQFNLNESAEENTDKQVSWSKTTETEFWSDLLEDESVDLIYFLYVPSQTTDNNKVHEEQSSTSSATAGDEFTRTKCDRKNEKENKISKPIRIIEPDGESDGKTRRYLI